MAKKHKTLIATFYTEVGLADPQISNLMVTHEGPVETLRPRMIEAAEEWAAGIKSDRPALWGDALQDIPARIWRKYGIFDIQEVRPAFEINVDRFIASL